MLVSRFSALPEIKSKKRETFRIDDEMRVCLTITEPRFDLNIVLKNYCPQKQAHPSHRRWGHTASLLISEANFFSSALAVPLTSQDINGLVIEAKFFRQSARE